MEVDARPDTLPAAVPSLPTFLAAFLQAPYTPSVLRQALQKQLSPDEAVVVLEQCDVWLKRWLTEAEPVESRRSDDAEKRKLKGKGSRAVAIDVFKVTVQDGDAPTMDQVRLFRHTVLSGEGGTDCQDPWCRRLCRLCKRSSTRISSTFSCSAKRTVFCADSLSTSLATPT